MVRDARRGFDSRHPPSRRPDLVALRILPTETRDRFASKLAIASAPGPAGSALKVGNHDHDDDRVAAAGHESRVRGTGTFVSTRRGRQSVTDSESPARDLGS